MHGAEGGRALVDRGQKRVGHVRRLLGDQWIGAIQRHVGDHAEEARPPPPRHHVATHGEILQGDVAVELDVQPLGERPADDDAELIRAFGFGAESGAFVGRGSHGVEFGIKGGLSHGISCIAPGNLSFPLRTRKITNEVAHEHDRQRRPAPVFLLGL